MTTGMCFLLPSYAIIDLAESGFYGAYEAAVRTIASSASLRAQRATMTKLAQAGLAQKDAQGLAQLMAGVGILTPEAAERQIVYDAQHGVVLPGSRARGTKDGPVADRAVNEAFDGAELTDRFYREVFNLNGIGHQGTVLASSVHYGQDYDNAVWNGTQMVYGDGSGIMFARGALTTAVDVIGHEFTHGVTQFTAGLLYRSQSGALNESFSDVLGSLVKQFTRRQTADQADWLIGEGILGSAIQGRALRSLKDPGQAYNMDRQVGHMSQYVDLPADNDPRNDSGGVHINSGIPNRAFYLLATTLGGYAWEKAGPIWYKTLTEKLSPNSDFALAAAATVEVAGAMYGTGSLEQRAVRAAWQVVGITVPGAQQAARGERVGNSRAQERSTTEQGGTPTVQSATEVLPPAGLPGESASAGKQLAGASGGAPGLTETPSGQGDEGQASESDETKRGRPGGRR